jgi:HAD superfamily hydrolase (TIGR01509 family)
MDPAPRWPQAVVFDLDGVIVDSELVWDRARRELVEQVGGRWREGATKAMLGMSAPEWSRYVHDELEVALTPREINEQVLARLLSAYERELPLLPGAVDAVRALAAVWRLALATSSNRAVIDVVLAASGLEDCFAATVSGEEVARGKPAPDVYLAACARLEVEPGGAVAVEDSTNGLRSAAAAGMSVIAIPNRDFPPVADALALASLALASIHELTPAVVGALGERRGGAPAGAQDRAGGG